MRPGAGGPHRPERGRPAQGGGLSAPAPGGSTDRSAHAGSFGAAAAAYERGRPPYPEAALDWLLPPGARRVLDLGAGTGKLARQLAARGLEVSAVDPSAAMLEELRRAAPGVEAAVGAAEAIPFPAAAFDAVLVAQAWHWVDPAAAAPEVARVLRPGGRLGLVWNHRDEARGWARELGALLARLGSAEDGSLDPPVGPPFGPVERRDVPWSHPIAADELVDLVASRSYVILRPESERAAVLDAVRAVLVREPAFAGGGRAAMGYVARCARAVRP